MSSTADPFPFFPFGGIEKGWLYCLETLEEY